MKLVVADWESFFDSKEFTLSKLSTEAYVRDPRFEAHGVAIKWSADTRAQWYDERRARFVLKEHDWSDTFMVHHHAQFDSLIESHHYDVHPKMIGCTLSMARLLLGNHIGVSLDSVREQFGLPKKITPYREFDGKHWNELSPQVQQMIADGACDEVESIWTLFGMLLEKGFPRSELEIVDATIKMFSEPCLRADMDLLGRIWKKENDDKQRRITELGVDPKELSSSDKFAALLRAEGVEPATKTSPSNPDKQIWAFAKTDPFMQDLLEDENERLRTLAEARLGIKSTLLQTRAETIGFMARRGPLCVYLRMYGAHTTRWSGGDGSNFQNLKKSDPDFAADDGGLNIREALLAPEGYLLGAIDASQIECIAEDQIVLTDNGPKAIQSVELTDRVWDGSEWVAHEGVVYKGTREVITYQGLTATPEHVVYVRSDRGEEKMEMCAAAAFARDLVKTCPSTPVCKTSLPKSFVCWLQNLWRPRDKIQVQVGKGRGDLGSRELTTSGLRRSRNRPYQQRWPLRTWKLEVVNALRECQQPAYYLLGHNAQWKTIISFKFSSQVSRVRLRSRYDSEASGAWANGRRNYQTLQNCVLENDVAEANAATGALQKKKVYDIINAGPRHRFTVNGLLVSNCRILNYVAGQDDVIENFREHRDPYLNVASQFYGFPVTKEHKTERNVGKVLELQAGYGSGGDKIRATLRTKAGIILSPADGLKARDAYRDTHPQVLDLWKTGGRMLARLAGGPPLEWGPTLIKDGKIILPNGAPLQYGSIEYYRDNETDDSYWRVKTRRGWSKLYGAKLVENLIQALARVVMSDAMLRIRALGYRIVMTTHDELVVLIKKDGNEQRHLDLCSNELKRTPVWLPGIPLDADGVMSERYAK